MVHRISSDPQFPSAMSSQPEYQQMGSSSSTGPSPAVTMSSQVMVAAVIFLFVVVAFVVFLFLYAKHFWGPGRALRRSRARFVFADDPAHLVRRGLNATVLRSLPVTIYQSVDFKEGGLECSVCLTELSDGEEARLLPKCNHGFHRECIDMWFHSHSTCPLCRCPVGPVPSAHPHPHPDTMEALPREDISISTESLVLPTNVLFWGTQDLVSTRELVAQQQPAPSSSSSAKPEGMLVIEIPRRVVEGFGSPLPTSWFPGEEMKTPPSTRLRSLRRLLSRGKRTVGSSCSPSPRGGDIEQGGGRASIGEGSSLAPRTPTTS